MPIGIATPRMEDAVTDEFRTDSIDAHFGESSAASFVLPSTANVGGEVVDDLQRFGGGDERSSARELARQWRLPYLEEEGLAVDAGSVARVGREELGRMSAVPVRCADGSLRVVLAEATSERFAAVREHFSTEVSLAVVTPSTFAGLLEATMTPTVEETESTAPAWGQTFERLLGLFDDEAGRLQALRQKLQQLGSQMKDREQRVEQLEAELAQVRIDRIRDQETIDRLRHELGERDGRLDRAARKAQELAAIIHGGGLR